MSFFNLFKKKPAPIVIQNALGEFTLRYPQKDNHFEGEIDWLGEMVSVSLYFDEGGIPSADKAFAHLRQLVEHAGEWDARLRQVVLEDLAEADTTVEIWGDGIEEEPSIISTEEFLQRISIGFLVVYPNGDLYFDYHLDGMFNNHGFGISANISGEIDSCGLMG